MIVVIYAYIYDTESYRFKCVCKNKYKVHYKNIGIKYSDGYILDTKLPISSSFTVEPLKCECDAKNNKIYLKILNLLWIPVLLVPFYGYCIKPNLYFSVGHMTFMIILLLIFGYRYIIN